MLNYILFSGSYLKIIDIQSMIHTVLQIYLTIAGTNIQIFIIMSLEAAR